jgi:hypothetical protein
LADGIAKSFHSCDGFDAPCCCKFETAWRSPIDFDERRVFVLSVKFRQHMDGIRLQSTRLQDRA